MTEPRFDPRAPDTHLAVQVLVGLVDPELDTLTPMQYRPVFVLVVETQAKDLAGPGPDLQMLVNWMALATLAGQLGAVYRTLPVDRRDQWDAIAQKAFTASMEIAESGRPTD